MKLFANGCSWTYGGGLNLDDISQTNERLPLVWTHHLGKLINADKVTNLAAGCGSNQRMFRTTFDWLTQQTQEELEDTVAVIQFTDPSRFEVNLDDTWFHCKIDCVIYDWDRNLEQHENDKLAQVYSLVKNRFMTNSSIEDEYNLLSLVHSFDNLFEKFKLKNWYFWSAIHSFAHSKYKDYYFDNFKIIDKQYLEPIWVYDRVGNQPYNNEFDPHPGITGHFQIAKALFQEMETYK